VISTRPDRLIVDAGNKSMGAGGLASVSGHPELTSFFDLNEEHGISRSMERAPCTSAIRSPSFLVLARHRELVRNAYSRRRRTTSGGYLAGRPTRARPSGLVRVLGCPAGASASASRSSPKRLFEFFRQELGAVGSRTDQRGTLKFITPSSSFGPPFGSGRAARYRWKFHQHRCGPDTPTRDPFHEPGPRHRYPIDGLRLLSIFWGMACHGDCHHHVDALCHSLVQGTDWNGKPRGRRGGPAEGTPGHHRDALGLVAVASSWTSPAFASEVAGNPVTPVTRAELEACAAAATWSS